MKPVKYTYIEFVELSEKEKYKYFSDIIDITLATLYPTISMDFKNDLRQECFLVLYKIPNNRIKLSDKNSFSYFYFITRNEAIRQYRYIKNIVNTKFSKTMVHSVELNIE